MVLSASNSTSSLVLSGVVGSSTIKTNAGFASDSELWMESNLALLQLIRERLR